MSASEAVADAYADKLPAQLAALDPGESVSKVKRLALDSLTVEDLLRWKRKMRNDASAAIQRAKRRAAGAEFKAETGDFRTETDDIIVCVVITREA